MTKDQVEIMVLVTDRKLKKHFKKDHTIFFTTTEREGMEDEVSKIIAKLGLEIAEHMRKQR